jgi:SNF2 family DNA or RNA helicase
MHQIQMGGNQILVPKYYTNLDELEWKLKSFSYRVKKDECLDLPPKLYQQRQVNLSTEQATIYNRLKKRARAIIEDKTVSFKNNPKLKDLMALLEESDGKVIIWANYVYNIKQIKSALEERYGNNSVVSIFGEVDVEGRKDAVNNFQLNDRCRFLVGNPATGGYGLTLTAARYVVYFSNSYNLEVRWQSEDRAHRIGQKDKVTYIDLMVPESLDVMIMSALDRKIKLSAQTLGEEAKRFLS